MHLSKWVVGNSCVSCAGPVLELRFLVKTSLAKPQTNAAGCLAHDHRGAIALFSFATCDAHGSERMAGKLQAVRFVPDSDDSVLWNYSSAFGAVALGTASRTDPRRAFFLRRLSHDGAVFACHRSMARRLLHRADNNLCDLEATDAPV